MNPSSLIFFLRESKYMELELRSVELQGAHEAGGAPRGQASAPPSWIGCGPPSLDSFPIFFYYFQKDVPWSFRSFQELLFLHKNNTMAILLKTTSVRVSSIQIMQVRVQNKGKRVCKSFSLSLSVCQLNGLRTSKGLSLGELIRLHRIYFSKHFCPCFGL